jgi:peptidoglycan/LPS O-acetylase OafA/YrhL
MTGTRGAVRAAVLDVAVVLVFVVIGRANHHDGETVPGVASTAWPFLAGLGAGWLVARGWRRPAALVPSGVAAWLGAVAVGMVLRVVAGQGTAISFIIVALCFLGLFLLGWRLLARIFSPRPASGRPATSRPR